MCLAENKNFTCKMLLILHCHSVLHTLQGCPMTANIRYLSTRTYCRVVAPNLSPHSSGVMYIKYLATAALKLFSPFIHSGSVRDSIKTDGQKPVLSGLMMFSLLTGIFRMSSYSVRSAKLLLIKFKYRNFGTGFKERNGCAIRNRWLLLCKELTI